MGKIIVLILLSVLLNLAYPPQLSSQSRGSPGASEPQEKGTATLDSSDVRSVEDGAPEPLIAGGDLLDITVFETDFSCGQDKTQGCQTRVSGSGVVVLPLVGSVKVAGLTVAQAEQLIASRLAAGGFFNDPQVSVVQKEYSTQGISLMGEVQKPGSYPLLGSHTLLEAISAAGGLTVKAGNEVTVLHRDHPNNPQHVDLSAPSSSNVAVLPGDTIVVSKAGIVYVVGDVRTPSGVVMERSGLTVLKAIAMAQGTNSTASLNNAKLIRTTATGKQEIPIPLKKILSNQSPDLELQPEDIVFVPTSVAKSAGRRSMEAILQTATGVAIYRP